jgi:hypothetical protein
MEPDDAFSRSTLYNRIRKQGNEAPSGIELTKKLTAERRLGNVLSFDTTHMKFSVVDPTTNERSSRVAHSYFHFIDLSTDSEIDYGIERREDADTVIRRLAAIKYDLKYDARVVVTDLDPAHLQAIPTIYPNATIQGCLFHLELLLNKRLPTREDEKRESKRRPKKPQTLLPEFFERAVVLTPRESEKLRLYRQVKKKVMEAARAADRLTQNELVAQLKRIPIKISNRQQMNLTSQSEKLRGKDYTRVDEVIKNFSDNLKFYHTRDELSRLGLTENMCYSNQCENGIGQIRLLFKRHKQFRSLEAARGHINYYWWKKRTAPANLSPWSLSQDILNEDKATATPSYGLDNWQNPTKLG